jgi:hypothetical protein
LGCWSPTAFGRLTQKGKVKCLSCLARTSAQRVHMAERMVFYVE